MGRLPPALPVEGRAAALPVEGPAAAFPVEGRAPALPVEGMPVEGRAPAVPVEGRAPALPVEVPAPPEPQPRESIVRAEFAVLGAPLLLSRLWSGCHFCAVCCVGRLPPPETFPELFRLFRL